MLSLLWLLFLLQISRHFAHSIYVLNCVQCVHQSINECASIFAKPHYFFSSFWLVGGYTFSLSLPLILLQFSFLCVGCVFFSWSENALRPDCFIYLCNIHFGSYTIHRGFHICNHHRHINNFVHGSMLLWRSSVRFFSVSLRVSFLHHNLTMHNRFGTAMIYKLCSFVIVCFVIWASAHTFNTKIIR